MNEFVGKYYLYDLETEDLLFDGLQLRNGMRVLAGAPLRQWHPNNHVLSTEENELFQTYNYWMTVTNITFDSISTSFMAVYDDGRKRKIKVATTHAWVVKKDSVPPVDEIAGTYVYTRAADGFITLTMTDDFDTFVVVMPPTSCSPFCVRDNHREPATHRPFTGVVEPEETQTRTMPVLVELVPIKHTDPSYVHASSNPDQCKEQAYDPRNPRETYYCVWTADPAHDNHRDRNGRSWATTVEQTMDATEHAVFPTTEKQRVEAERGFETYQKYDSVVDDSNTDE